jgi:hypothetical protein
MTPQYLRNLKLLAVHAVAEEPSDYTLRKIMRWYSHEYHTPLDAVEDLPLEDVLQHWFETHYEGYEDGDLQAEIDRLLTSEDKLAEMRRQEDAEEADQWEFGREALAEEEKKATAPLQDIQDELKMAIPEVKIQAVTAPLPPDVHMMFEDIDTDAFPDAQPFGPPPKIQ